MYDRVFFYLYIFHIIDFIYKEVLSGNIYMVFIYRVSQKKYRLLKMLTKENLLAIDCKHVLRAVSVLTFGSFTLYNFNFTIVCFSKKLFRRFKKTVLRGI